MDHLALGRARSKSFDSAGALLPAAAEADKEPGIGGKPPKLPAIRTFRTSSFG
jgi:hypothetical protein